MRSYKRKRQEGSKMTRSEFAMSEMLSARETRLAQRGQTSKVKKKFPKFVQRCRYISTRVAELETRMGKTSEEVDRLGACMSNNLRGLLPPKDAASSPGAADATPAGGNAQSEGGKRPKAAAPSPVSEKQLSRLMSQAHAVSLVLRGEIERDKLQVQHFKEAEVLAQTEAPPTAADLKVWVAKISAVMDKAVAVRQEFPLLGIAENVVESWRLTQKPSTLVLWTHEFWKLGGFFKRDERGL